MNDTCSDIELAEEKKTQHRCTQRWEVQRNAKELKTKNNENTIEEQKNQ